MIIEKRDAQPNAVRLASMFGRIRRWLSKGAPPAIIERALIDLRDTINPDAPDAKEKALTLAVVLQAVQSRRPESAVREEAQYWHARAALAKDLYL